MKLKWRDSKPTTYARGSRTIAHDHKDVDETNTLIGTLSTSPASS